ncbi:hypothetical protein D3C78_927700 [compost metagenome]
MHHAPAVLQRQLGHRQLAQAAAGQLQAHRMARQQGQAEAGQHAGALRLLGAELQGVGEVRALVVAEGLAGLAGARTRLAHQQRLVGQLLQAEALALAQRMPGRGHGDDLVGEKRHELQVHAGGHLGEDHQLVAADTEATQCLGMAGDGELQTDLRVLLAEGGEQVRHHIFGAGLHGQAELPLQRAAQVGKLHVEAFQAGEDVRPGTLQGLGGVGQVELLADVLEQRLADQLLELADLLADRRLGQRHFFGGAAVGAGLAHRTEHLQLAQGQPHQVLAHNGKASGTGVSRNYKSGLMHYPIIIHF